MAREKSDHDLLVSLNVKVEDLSTHFTNHLHHHLLYTIALFTAFLSLVGGIIVYFVTRG